MLELEKDKVKTGGHLQEKMQMSTSAGGAIWLRASGQSGSVSHLKLLDMQ